MNDYANDHVTMKFTNDDVAATHLASEKVRYRVSATFHVPHPEHAQGKVVAWKLLAIAMIVMQLAYVAISLRLDSPPITAWVFVAGNMATCFHVLLSNIRSET